MFQMFNRSAVKANRILQIGFVTQNASVGRELKKFVAQRDGIDLKLIESASVTAKSPPRDVGIFVYDLDASSEASMQEFERFMTQRPGDIPVIVLSPAVDEELVRWFLRLRVSDWVKTPLSPGELIAACGRVMSQPASGRQIAKCLTFTGARGGVGTTTMALHAALILSAQTAPASSTCLIDLDLVAGVTDYLDLKPGWQIDELIADPARLDGHMMEIMAVNHKAGIAVLSAQRKYCETSGFSEEVVTRALDLAAQKYQTLIVDLPRHAESWTDGVMLGSTDVFVVTEFTVPGLRAARRMCNDIAVRYAGEIKPKVIVNKFSTSLFGSSLSAKEAKTILRDDLVGYVHSDPKLMREAVDRGIPTSEIKARNGLIKDVTKILGGA